MNSFKKNFNNTTRFYIKKYLTGSLGKVVEDDEKITCYVKASKIRKTDYNYTIACFGIGEEEKKVAKEFQLDKPICYVIDGIDFKSNRVYIFGYDNCEVIIKDCNFELGLHVNVEGKCTLDNTTVTSLSNFSISANDLVIKNMGSEHIKVIGPKPEIGFDVENRIDIIDSIIGSQKKDTKVSFAAINELNVVNSKIVGKEVNCSSSSINADEKSSLIATNKVNLQTDNFNSISVNAPTIVLNSEVISYKNKSVALSEVTESLKLKRFELVNLLKNVKSQCENATLEHQVEPSIQPVSKVLKK